MTKGFAHLLFCSVTVNRCPTTMSCASNMARKTLLPSFISRVSCPIPSTQHPVFCSLSPLQKEILTRLFYLVEKNDISIGNLFLGFIDSPMLSGVIELFDDVTCIHHCDDCIQADIRLQLFIRPQSSCHGPRGCQACGHHTLWRSDKFSMLIHSIQEEGASSSKIRRTDELQEGNLVRGLFGSWRIYMLATWVRQKRLSRQSRGIQWQ